MCYSSPVSSEDLCQAAASSSIPWCATRLCLHIDVDFQIPPPLAEIGDLLFSPRHLLAVASSLPLCFNSFFPPLSAGICHLSALPGSSACGSPAQGKPTWWSVCTKEPERELQFSIFATEGHPSCIAKASRAPYKQDGPGAPGIPAHRPDMATLPQQHARAEACKERRPGSRSRSFPMLQCCQWHARH